MDRFWPWDHFGSYHLLDWIDLLTQNPYLLFISLFGTKSDRICLPIRRRMQASSGATPVSNASRDLGHPPKFYRVQDAGFIGGSSIWWQIIAILKKNHLQIFKNHVFSQKWYKKKKEENNAAGMLATEVRAGDAPKPLFSMKTDEKLKKIRKSTPDQPQKFVHISESAIFVISRIWGNETDVGSHILKGAPSFQV